MTDGVRIVTIPRHDPLTHFTMSGIVRDAGLTEQQFREAALNASCGTLSLFGAPPSTAVASLSTDSANLNGNESETSRVVTASM